ncbi:MAG: 5'-nucleotidase [Bacteroidales bacterium]|nr:5'-nucleotidase [Bacteroidales bacterium]
MKPINKLLIVLGILRGTLLAGCQSNTKKTTPQITGKLVQMDSTWDSKADSNLIKLIEPYKTKVDSVMNQVIGEAEITLKSHRPESLLSNLVADVLREAAIPVLGHPADMGLVNMGGLRNIISKGQITEGDVYEILPFENSLCIVTLQGKDLKLLLENIASVKGEGVSNLSLKITETGQVIDSKINGQPLEDLKEYTIATIDYLADGNDGMVALMQAKKRICPKGATLRGLFLDYIKKQTAQNKKISAQLENRITIIKD